MTPVRRLAPLALCLALGACQSQWFMEHDQSEIVTTNVLVFTQPEGARVDLNGVYQADAPVRIPIEYSHTEQLWSRQTNAGARMREGMSPVVQVLTFPVWLIASVFHSTEDVRRHVYDGNRHSVRASAPQHQELTRVVQLEGEDEIRVELVLPRK